MKKIEDYNPDDLKRRLAIVIGNDGEHSITVGTIVQIEAYSRGNNRLTCSEYGSSRKGGGRRSDIYTKNVELIPATKEEISEALEEVNRKKEELESKLKYLEDKDEKFVDDDVFKVWKIVNKVKAFAGIDDKDEDKNKALEKMIAESIMLA